MEYRNVVDGYVRIFWGLFKKMVIADRMALMVNQVFDHYADYHGAVILAAAIGYVIQLYMEFSGCMDIIIGSGKLFGICLPENFRQPFCAKNPSEFWRRWHITLGAWFKAYIFYPVSVSGLVKKALRKAYYKTGDFCNLPVPSAGCERSLAWRTVELYFLWNVLFCIDHAWDCCGAGSRPYFRSVSY